MHTTVRHGCLIGLFAVFLGAGSAMGISICSPDGTQQSGSIYRICLPPDGEYNGRLVIWAHGFQDAGTPVQIPEGQLQLGEVYLPELVNQLGFGFATNSYSKTGLAVRQGMKDILDLVRIYTAQKGRPEHVYLIGASEGGLITALLVEQHPQVFSAGLAACGPVGDFPYEINYFGDARATFQYFFPEVIPGDPFDPAPELTRDWANYYETTVEPTVFASRNRSLLDQWVKVARLPFDADRYLETVAVSARDVLRYAVVNLHDVTETLKGFPFDNLHRWYSGSADDFRLNFLVPRRSADSRAIGEMKKFYNTHGRLERPLITLHTLRDQQVPYRHEDLYTLKTSLSGSFLVDHVNLPVNRFGHCKFTIAEAVGAFGLMLLYAEDLDVLVGVGSILQGEHLAAFERLAQRHALPYRIAGQTFTAQLKRR